MQPADKGQFFSVVL